MGIHLRLHILPTLIEPQAWAEAYDDTLRLLQAHPAPLMGYDWREVEGVQVPAYTSRLEPATANPAARCWRVLGDFASRETGESFELFRDLGYYHRRQRREAPATDADIVLVAAADLEAPVWVFTEKTQGAPFHLPMLAAAMVVETRFPRHAMVSGDFDCAQAQRAAQWAESVLGYPLPVPVRADPPALRERLRAQLAGGELTAALSRLLVADYEQHDAVLLAALPRPLAEDWLLAELRDAGPATVQACQVCGAWLDATGDLGRLAAAACRDEAGPHWSADRLGEVLEHLGLAAPPPAAAPSPPVPGEPETIDVQLARALRDLGGYVRPVTRPFSHDALAAALAGVFGLGARPLLDRLERSRGPEAAIDPAAAFAPDAASAPAATAEPRRSLAARLATERPEDLTPDETEAVLALAWAVRQIEDMPAEAAGALGAATAPELRAGLARLLADRGPCLTDATWTALAAESDLDLLHFLLIVAVIDLPGLRLVRRAVLDNLPLARFAAAQRRDEVAMARIGAQARRLGRGRPGGSR
ncbi:MAG TPA: hypothetical protein VGQ83_17120 [Polyangia bacterium]|jgi:hypothetical protein